MNTQFIKIDMTPSGINPTFHISQYDVGRVLGFMVYNGSEVVDLDTYTCKVEAERTDGTGITANVTTNDNIGTFSVTATMSNKADKYRGQLVITKSGQRIASLPFIMDVCEAGMDENSSAIIEDASLFQQFTRETNVKLAQEITTRQNADTTLQNNIAVEENARANADNSLQTQINQIVAPTGEAPNPAEITDARIGWDNTVYTSLGLAIRGQVTDIHKLMMLEAENIPNTTQTLVYGADGNISTVYHKNSSNVALRTDVFTFTNASITEVRTLSSGETLTLVTNRTTFATTVTYAAA